LNAALNDTLSDTGTDENKCTKAMDINNISVQPTVEKLLKATAEPIRAHQECSKQARKEFEHDRNKLL
jgi:hypothetical protein